MNMQAHWYLLPVFLAVFLLLSGCQTAPVQPAETAATTVNAETPVAPSTAGAVKSPTFHNLQNFEIEGRMGVQTDGKGVSGKMHWIHQHGNDEIGFYSPMGGKIASVTTSSEEVTLIASDGKVYTAPDAETLTEQALGWRLPVSNLTDWIVGRPTKGPYEHLSLDDAGRITKLIQDGWEIEYLEYLNVEGQPMPTKLTLRNPKLYVKLIIERWDTSANDVHEEKSNESDAQPPKAQPIDALTPN